MNAPLPETHILVQIGRQSLRFVQAGRLLLACPVSTARNGPGERSGSECTPRGWHAVAEKVGADHAPGSVFVARRWTGELYSPELRATHPGRDWILTRILWLEGREAGRNQGGEVDSRARYIYLHGAPDDVPMGVPGSRGCVRMRHGDVLTLFDLAAVGTPVLITED
jgi:lipoprotein-anchoring transpeptidase ErfK/SrfK